MKLLDYDALIKITVRVINKKIIDTFNIKTFHVKNFIKCDYEYYITESVNEYCSSKELAEDIEVEKLANGLHFFIIGFNVENTYDYQGESDADYFGTVLSHDRPANLNEVRLFLAEFESSFISPNENKINKLYDVIERERNRECAAFLFNGLKDS